MSWHDDDDDRALSARRSGSSVRKDHPGLFPVLLIAIGASWGLHLIVGHGVGGVFPLAIGMFLIARSGGGDHYPLFVIGVVLAGSGAGSLLGDLIGGSDAFGTLGAAAGFLWLATADKRKRSNWAMIPAVILGLIGIARLGVDATRAFTGSPGWVVPAGVVVAGVLLLGAHRLPGPIRLGGLIFVAAAVLSLLAHDNHDNNQRDAVKGPRVLSTVPASSVNLASYALDTKTLWLETENGSIVVNAAGDPTARVSAGRLKISDNADRVDLVAQNDNGSITVGVAPGTKLHLRSENGDVIVNVAAGSLDVETENGAINVLAGRDQTIAATTRNGSVSAPGFNGVTASEGVFAQTGTDGTVVLRSDNGDIAIRHADDVPAQSGAR